MTHILIVSAHPEPQSFTHAWARSSLLAAQSLGASVDVADLHATGFDPVESGVHFGVSPFDPLKAHVEAPTPKDVQAHIEKIEAADLVIFHFPIWWFAAPAIVKGWCDRVLLHGQLHSVDRRFDTGPCKGKRALFCVTTGAGAAEVGPRGKEGNLDLLLWPLAYTLRYCGFSIYQHKALHNVHGYWEGAEKTSVESHLAQALADQKSLIANLADRPLLQFHNDHDFDEDGRLRDGIDPLWPFHG